MGSYDRPLIRPFIYTHPVFALPPSPALPTPNSIPLVLLTPLISLLELSSAQSSFPHILPPGLRLSPRPLLCLGEVVLGGRAADVSIV